MRKTFHLILSGLLVASLLPALVSADSTPVTESISTLTVATATPTPTPTPTPTATPAATPTATPAALPSTGSSPFSFLSLLSLFLLSTTTYFLLRRTDKDRS